MWRSLAFFRAPRGRKTTRRPSTSPAFLISLSLSLSLPLSLFLFSSRYSVTTIISPTPSSFIDYEGKKPDRDTVVCSVDITRVVLSPWSYRFILFSPLFLGRAIPDRRNLDELDAVWLLVFVPGGLGHSRGVLFAVLSVVLPKARHLPLLVQEQVRLIKNSSEYFFLYETSLCFLINNLYVFTHVYYLERASMIHFV
jgi:hypothetical protein